jgi:hypothetical protein
MTQTETNYQAQLGADWAIPFDVTGYEDAEFELVLGVSVPGQQPPPPPAPPITWSYWWGVAPAPSPPPQRVPPVLQQVLVLSSVNDAASFDVNPPVAMVTIASDQQTKCTPQTYVYEIDATRPTGERAVLAFGRLLVSAALMTWPPQAQPAKD